MNFVSVKVDWYWSTFLLYLGVILSCYLVTAACRRRVLVCGSTRRFSVQMWLAFVAPVLVFLKGFGTAGRDLRGGYYLNFLSATSLKQFRDQTVEIGYRLLCVIVRNITGQYWVWILVYSLITIVPVIHMLIKYANQLDLPTGVLLYVTCYYFQGFSLIRICMAASLSLYAFDAIVEEKPLKALFWIFISSCFHTSALAALLPYGICLARKLNRKMIAFSLLAVFVMVLVGRSSLVALLFSTSERYAHYLDYVATDAVRIGRQQFARYLPLFIIFYYGRKASPNRHFTRVSFAYLAAGFFIGMTSYIIQILGRMEAVFLPVVIIVPYFCRQIKNRYPRYKALLNVLTMVYCITRFIIYISGYYDSDDIMPYSNIFGWVI